MNVIDMLLGLELRLPNLLPFRGEREQNVLFKTETLLELVSILKLILILFYLKPQNLILRLRLLLIGLK